VADESLAKYYDTVVGYCGGAFDCRAVADAAINHRPEITQASLAAEVTCLEIEAQGFSLHIYSRTFAATADIHSKVLPAGSSGEEYRPGAIGPDMPVFLAGSRADRMQRAGHLYERAVAVAEKAKGLVALEVQDACLRLQQEGNQVTLLRQAIEQAAKSVKDAEQAYRDDQLKTDQMIAIQIVEAQTRAQLNETMYRYGLALASLQRAAAGKLWGCVGKPVVVEVPKAVEPEKLPR
jgi:outer membrane protein TolC